MRKITISFLAILLTALPLAATFAQNQTTIQIKQPVVTKNAKTTKTMGDQSVKATEPSMIKLSSTHSMVPEPPKLDVHSYILIDAKSGAVIAAQDPDKRVEPASLTKLMTLYLIADALKANRINLDDEVTISKNAWRTGGSRMFAKVGAKIPAQDLINGIIVASGNDATVAMAEFVGGSEPIFVDLMNKTAAKLGMNHSSFMDSNGLPHPDHYTTVRDLSTLARAWIHDFPEDYAWFNQKWIKYNGIRQPNRNRLLWRDPSVDGMKTGHTDAAGYCLAASGTRHGMRLIAIVMGAKSDQARTDYTESLLNYGFRFFETHKVYAGNTALLNSKIKYGKNSTTPIGLNEDLYVTVPNGMAKNIKTSATLNPKLEAPIKKGQACGSVSVTLDGKQLLTKPLIALDANPEGGFFTKLVDSIHF